MDANAVGLGFDSSEVIRGVDKAESSLDHLMGVLVKLDRTMASMQKSSSISLNRATDSYAALGDKAAKAFVDSQHVALTALKAGSYEMVETTKRQNAALQQLFEARLANAGRLSNAELQVWKNHGAKLGAIQNAQLKGFKLDDVLSSAGGANFKEVREAYEKFKELTLMRERLFTKAGSLATPDNGLRLMAVRANEDSESLKLAYQKLEANGVLRDKALARINTPVKPDNGLRLLAVQANEDANDMVAAYKKLEAVSNLKTQIQARLAGGVMAGPATSATRGQSASTMGSASQAAISAAALAQTREMYLQDGFTSKYDGTSLDKLNQGLKDTARNSVEAGNGFRRLASDGNDVHSMVRGLASGFGMLWLTWGNLAPLFIGAGISNAFVQTAKTGMEVAHTMEIIASVGGNTRVEMAGLTAELDRMGKDGPFGPLAIAEAMKTLSLAGLKANEILAVTQDVLNFSVAGTTDLKTAADTLMSVSTAFGLGSVGFSKVGDVISKAAAESMTSVESFSNAMKTASVINAQYGVSLEDTATGIALLSQLGIQGTAAGTALRNMYADLSGRSAQVARVLKQQGIEMRDANGEFRPMIEVVAELSTKFSKLTGIGQKNLMQALLSERGAKPLVEALRLIGTTATDAGAGAQNALEQIRRSIGDSAGFAAIKSAEMAQTAQNQFASVKATLQSTMVEVYRDMEPSLLLIAHGMKEAFASPEFKEGLGAMVVGIAEFSKVLVENIDLIVKAALLYASLKVAQMAVVATLGLLNVASEYRNRMLGVEATALAANTTAQNANNAAKAGALGTMGLLARAVPFVGTAIAVASTAWMAYEYWMNRSKDTAQASADLYNTSVVKNLADEANKLERINALLRTGLTLKEAQARMNAGLDAGAGRSPAFVKAQAELESAESEVARMKALRGGKGAAGPVQRAEAEAEKARKARNAASKAEADAKIDSEKQLDRVRRASVEQADFLAAEEAKARKRRQNFGTEGYEMGSDNKPRFDKEKAAADQLARSLDGLLEREIEQQAVYEARKNGTVELLKVEQEKIKQLAELDEKYAKAAAAGLEMNKFDQQALAISYEKIRALILENAESGIWLGIADERIKKQLELQDLQRKEVSMMSEMATAREAEMRNKNKELGRSEEDVQFQRAMMFATDTEKAIAKSKLDINRSYEDTKLKMIEKSNEALAKITDPELADGEAQRLKAALGGLDEQKAKELGIAQSSIYLQAWDANITQLSKNFVDQMMDGTFDLTKFMKDAFANLVLRPQLEIAAKMGMDMLGKALGLGGGGGGGGFDLFGSIFSAVTGAFTGGSDANFGSGVEFGSQDLGLNFEGGGYTGSGVRAGGLDGKGGMLAMVHPDESVIDHTKGGTVGGPTSVVIYNTVGDVATKKMLDESTQGTIRQIQAGMGRSARYNGVLSS
jgi:TP901 family phage tail tape measure protein